MPPEFPTPNKTSSRALPFQLICSDYSRGKACSGPQVRQMSNRPRHPLAQLRLEYRQVWLTTEQSSRKFRAVTQISTRNTISHGLQETPVSRGTGSVLCKSRYLRALFCHLRAWCYSSPAICRQNGAELPFAVDLTYSICLNLSFSIQYLIPP